MSNNKRLLAHLNAGSARGRRKANKMKGNRTQKEEGDERRNGFQFNGSKEVRRGKGVYGGGKNLGARERARR